MQVFCLLVGRYNCGILVLESSLRDHLGQGLIPSPLLAITDFANSSSHLHTTYSCFHTTKAEMSSCHRACMACKLKMFTNWPFIENVCQHVFLDNGWQIDFLLLEILGKLIVVSFRAVWMFGEEYNKQLKFACPYVCLY